MDFDFMSFFDYLVRWGHIVFGIAWIGLLYYFNFVQGAFMAAASNDTKVEAFTMLVPKALWWFRWAAAFTFLTGLYLLYVVAMRQGMLTEDTLVAVLLATFMAANVWFVIWPNQKVVIASNEAVKAGGDADPNQGSAAAAALLASRTNVLFSLAMVFTMVSSAHINYTHGDGMGTSEALASAWGFYAVAAIAVLIELNAIFGKMNPLIESVKAVITSSVVLTIIVWALLYFL